MARFATIVLAMSLSCLAAPSHADDAHVAIFKNVTGSIKVVRDGQTFDATPGFAVFSSDQLISGPKSSAGVVFRDGTLITVGASSELQIRDYAFDTKDSNYQFSMYLARGSAVYSSGKIGKLAPESVKIDTPTTTVGVRGTRCIVTAQ
jgi:hypothetical protein